MKQMVPGLSIVEQYAKRQQRARENWALHLLLAAGPFCVFIWGPSWTQFYGIAGFAVFFFHGIYRQRKIDRCPACDASRVKTMLSIGQGGSPRRLPPYCESCGEVLIIEKTSRLF